MQIYSINARLAYFRNKIKMAAFLEQEFQNALKMACSFFLHDGLYDKLHEEQVMALRQFFSGKDIFFSAPTGFGKSIIYQLIPVTADIIVVGTSVVIVITSLKALVKDKVKYLNEKTGVSLPTQ